MKILFVAPYLPIFMRVRPYRLIRYLSQYHEITLACLTHPAWVSQYADELKSYCTELHTININRVSSFLKSGTALFSELPMSVAYFQSRELKSLIELLIQDTEFDLIHTEFIRAAPYTANILGLPKLFDSVDSLVLAYERGWRNRYGSFYNRGIAFEEWLKMRSYEPKMIRLFDRVVVSSPADQKLLLSSSGPSIDILPNGVDHEYYYWSNQDRDENSIVFVGQMNYYVNVDSILHFHSSTFPQIQKHNPDIHFSIVGADPRKSIRKLANNSAIEVTGFVPDLRPYIVKAAVFVCPLICGSGIQNKLLQAMAMGTPVVTTSYAIQALQVKDGEHLLVADTPNQFADAVSNLMSDKKLQKRLSENARNYIQEFHDWNVIGQKLEAIYEGMVRPNINVLETVENIYGNA